MIHFFLRISDVFTFVNFISFKNFLQVKFLIYDRESTTSNLLCSVLVEVFLNNRVKFLNNLQMIFRTNYGNNFLI